MMFPTISGKNLHNEMFTLPGDFWGQYNVVLLAFTEEQQVIVDTWSDFLRQLRREHPIIDVYELPVGKRFPWYQRMMLDYWMRGGIPDPDERATTITLYTDVPDFLSALNLPDASQVYILLVDRDGHIHWKECGAYTAEKGRTLARALKLLPVRVW